MGIFNLNFMDRTIVGLCTAILVVGPSNAALNCCWGTGSCLTLDSTYDSSCTDPLICSCKTTSTTSKGIVTTHNKKLVTSCVGNKSYAKCQTQSTTYKCAAGYYGTAVGNRSGCTACPSNATCAGGNNSTFSCNRVYYKNGSACTVCPGGGTTSAAGATSVSSCYIPSGTSFSDATGSGTYTSNCPY